MFGGHGSFADERMFAVVVFSCGAVAGQSAVAEALQWG
jgi:TfoX/Sxy family transcriptional regulator of competence genes